MIGVCALHPDREAAFVCARCGDNGCTECANRVVAGAQPICSTCWSKRAQRVATLQKDEATPLVWYGLGLGIVGLVPLLFGIQIAAVVLGIFALRRMPEGAPRRGFAWVAITCGAVGLLGSFIALVAIAIGAA